MKSLIALFLIFTTISNIKGSYSIDAFYNYLEEKGFYAIIFEIKHYFGDEIAIGFCKTLVNSNDCEIVVKTYMTGGNPPFEEENKKSIEQIIDDYYLVLVDNGLSPNEIALLKEKMKVHG